MTRAETAAVARGSPSAVGRILRAAGPAWIVMLADVDAPSVISAGQAGTDFAYAAIFPLVLCIPALYLVQEMTTRLAIVTGKGHAELIRERYGMGWATVAVVSMVAIDLIAYVAEFAGIALGAAILGIPAAAAIGGALVLHTLWVLTGSYRRFEVVTIALSLTLLAFVLLALAGHPDPAAILGGLSPLQPFGDARYQDLAVALVGASIMPWMVFYQQAATAEKGLGLDDLPGARKETLISAVVSQALMVAIVVAAAVGARTMRASRIVPDAGGVVLPSGLASLAAGGWGPLVAVGLVGAGLLAAVVISLSSAWAWCELFGWPHRLDLSPRRASGFYLLYALEVVPAAAIALAAPHLVTLILEAMILNVIALVVPLVFLIRLSGDRALLGALASSRRRSAVLWVLTAVLVGSGLLSLTRMLAR
ncbi:MAG: divalent metal cation transporter [Chloroflexota bacterium]|nr:divalent metal cation transporter [Chloroflexota bacterium]